MNENVVSMTCKNVAELMFNRKECFPEFEFYITKDSFGEYSECFEIQSVNVADSYMVVGNYFGGGSPFLYDIADDNDESCLCEAMSIWLKENGCDEENGDLILYVDKMNLEEIIPEVIIVIEGGSLENVYSSIKKMSVELIDLDVTDEEAVKDACLALKDIEKWEEQGLLFSHW